MVRRLLTGGLAEVSVHAAPAVPVAARPSIRHTACPPLEVHLGLDQVLEARRRRRELELELLRAHAELAAAGSAVGGSN